MHQINTQLIMIEGNTICSKLDTLNIAMEAALGHIISIIIVDLLDMSPSNSHIINDLDSMSSRSSYVKVTSVICKLYFSISEYCFVVFTYRFSFTVVGSTEASNQIML